MPPSGLKNKKNIHLSQKQTCGRIDRGARVYGGCCAHEDGYRYTKAFCHLGFKCEDRTPLEPCLKPITVSQYCYALRLRSLISPHRGAEGVRNEED